MRFIATVHIVTQYVWGVNPLYTEALDTLMKLNTDDISRLVRACRMYQDNTGSEYLWDEYQHLIHKLEYYEEEHCSEA